MTEKTINDIVWWIPIKSLRDNIRAVLYEINDIHKIIKDIHEIKDIHKINDIHRIITKKYSDVNDIYSCKLGGIDFKFYDFILSLTVSIVSAEIDGYNFDSIDFKEGDVVIDIGGNVGMVSIYLAKKYPFLKIYAFEPVKNNYENFLRNIELNNINKDIIKVFNLAITKDRRDVMVNSPFHNSGGSSIYNSYSGDMANTTTNIKSITLDDIFANNNISKCKLLKIDCEGAEYEILYNANIENLKNCEYLRGEFHGVNKQEDLDLYNYCSKYIKNIEITWNPDNYPK